MTTAVVAKHDLICPMRLSRCSIWKTSFSRVWDEDKFWMFTKYNYGKSIMTLFILSWHNVLISGLCRQYLGMLETSNSIKDDYFKLASFHTTYSRDLNISLSERTKNNCDSLSSGEWTGRCLAWIASCEMWADWYFLKRFGQLCASFDADMAGFSLIPKVF